MTKCNCDEDDDNIIHILLTCVLCMYTTASLSLLAPHAPLAIIIGNFNTHFSIDLEHVIGLYGPIIKKNYDMVAKMNAQALRSI